ncbi:hypothetical protein [Legionella sp. 31fI33]|uniref:hypothetical protein n=1 Tax=Legionella sp. 31fI33 TaxID=2886376 RepID=UPI001E41B609|nr:hypothetical protein [Legionella sp. 31fI33]MCC5016367.1 hypothetical protein [Legionella sp. 31fI33]
MVRPLRIEFSGGLTSPVEEIEKKRSIYLSDEVSYCKNLGYAFGCTKATLATLADKSCL